MYYAQTGKHLPEWLSQSSNDADLARLPAKEPKPTANPAAAAAPSQPPVAAPSQAATDAKRHIEQIISGSGKPADNTKAARKTLGIENHADLMQRAQAAIKTGDKEFLDKFNAAMTPGKAEAIAAHEPQPTAKHGGNETTPPEGQQETKAVPGSVFDAPQNSQDTPRQAAEETTKRQVAEDYAFARASKVSNAGEDLLGSARHRANAWRGLEQAEKDGNAADFVTRDMLLKAEPHGLMNHVATNPLTALAMHYALRNFPAKPQYGQRMLSGEQAKQAREQYLDVYRRYKAKAEDLAKGSEDPLDAAKQLQTFVENERGRLYKDGRTNPIANALYATSKHLGQRYGGIGKQMREFQEAFSRHYGPTAPDDRTEKLTDHVSDMIEGASLNKTFGIASDRSKRNPTFNPADAYVKKAQREGGPQIPVTTAEEGKKFLIDKLKMRGLQFGNYVTDEERQHHLTKVSEAFADLADVLGLPEHLISWKGKLGVAFGARGHGTASAHHEPSNSVINLTRASGVGALAHEWGHFLDHALGGFKTVSERSGYFSENAHAGNDPMDMAYAELHKAMDQSGFNRRLSGVLSKYVREKQMGEKKRDYWRSTREKFARCFERYVERKLEQAGRKNTYLAGLAQAHELWPSDAEVDAMAPAFEAIVAELRRNKEKYARIFAARPSATERFSRQIAERYARIAGRQVERYAKMAEGSTKVVDGRSYTLRGSRWHRTRQAEEAAPTIVVPEREFGDPADKPQVRQKAREFWRTTLKDRTFTNRDTGLDIGVSHTGIDEILAHSGDIRRAQLVAKLPEIIQSAAYLDDQPPHDPKTSTYPHWFYFHAEVVLGGKPVEFELQVGRVKVKPTPIRPGKREAYWAYTIQDIQEIEEARLPKEGPGPASDAAEIPRTAGPSSTPSIGPESGEVKRPDKESYARRLAGQLLERYARRTAPARAVPAISVGAGSAAANLARQLVERYARKRDVSDEARAADGTWTAGGGGSGAPVANVKTWLKERENLHPSDFRRELEHLGDEDLSAALEHVRSRGTAQQQHRLTGPLKAELKSRGVEPEPLVTGGDVALQAIDEGRPLASVRKATGLKAGPEHARLMKQAAAAYERMTRPEAHKARRALDKIEDGETDPRHWTAEARQALGIPDHAALLKTVAAAIKHGDEDFLRRFNLAMDGGLRYTK